MKYRDTRGLWTGMGLIALLAGMGIACGDDDSGPTDTGGDADVPGDVENETPTDTGADADADVPEEVPTDTPADEGGDPCATYPCGTYGTALGSILPDRSFPPGNDAATAMAGADGEFQWSDLYQLNEDHGGTLKGLLVFVTTEWCPYCAVEAPKLQTMYEDLQDQGILIVGVVTEDNSGNPATPAVAARYARAHGWTFPAVSGLWKAGSRCRATEMDCIDYTYWEPSVVESGEIGVPMHLYVDLRNMRLYGRASGAWEPKVLQPALEDLATTPKWASEGVREFSFDCATGTDTETEPNDFNDTPEDGTALPYDLAGTTCEVDVGDGLLLDQDIVDLGTLPAGTALDVDLTGADGSVYPFFQIMRLNAAGTALEWASYAPFMLGVSNVGRQWLLDTAGHYYLAIVDGRTQSNQYYGSGATIPLGDQCCEGGPDYTYDLAVTSWGIDVTETDPLVAGTPAAGAIDDGDVNVYAFEAVTGTAYTFNLTAGDTTHMDPYLTLYNPATSTVLGFNDDIDTAGGNYNSRITWTSTVTGTVWLAVGYWGAWFHGAAPTYTLTAAP